MKYVVGLENQEHHHYQKRWSLIHPSLNCTWSECAIWIWLIIIESHSISNDIGPSGATSLSEALKVNSSLTELNLRSSLLLNMIDWLLLNHIPFIPILVHQEQDHYQKHWRSIHHSLNCAWNWVYYWIWLIDYYSITFHL